MPRFKWIKGRSTLERFRKCIAMIFLIYATLVIKIKKTYNNGRISNICKSSSRQSCLTTWCEMKDNATLRIYWLYSNPIIKCTIASSNFIHILHHCDTGGFDILSDTVLLYSFWLENQISPLIFQEQENNTRQQESVEQSQCSFTHTTVPTGWPCHGMQMLDGGFVEGVLQSHQEFIQHCLYLLNMALRMGCRRSKVGLSRAFFSFSWYSFSACMPIRYSKSSLRRRSSRSCSL